MGWCFIEIDRVLWVFFFCGCRAVRASPRWTCRSATKSTTRRWCTWRRAWSTWSSCRCRRATSRTRAWSVWPTRCTTCRRSTSASAAASPTAPSRCAASSLSFRFGPRPFARSLPRLRTNGADLCTYAITQAIICARGLIVAIDRHGCARAFDAAVHPHTFFFVVVFALFHWGLERKGSILLRESGNIRFLFRFVFFFLFVLKKKGIRAPFGEVRFHSTGTRLLPFVFLFLKKIQFEWRLPWNFWEEKRTKPSRIDWDLNAVSSRLGHWNKRLWSPGTVTIHRFVSYSLEEFHPNRVDPIRSAISMEPQWFRFQHPPYWTTVRVSKRRRGCFSLFVCCFVV